MEEAERRLCTEGRGRGLQLERFLSELERQMPGEAECAIRDSAELYRMKTRFQALKEQCDDRTDQFRALNEEGADPRLVVFYVSHIH